MSWIAQHTCSNLIFVLFSCFVAVIEAVCSAIQPWFHNLVMCNRFVVVVVVVDFIIFNSDKPANVKTRARYICDEMMVKIFALFPYNVLVDSFKYTIYSVLLISCSYFFRGSSYHPTHRLLNYDCLTLFFFRFVINNLYHTHMEKRQSTDCFWTTCTRTRSRSHYPEWFGIFNSYFSLLFLSLLV